ncbi:unnamed protein product [Prorocentrum cordatum]|uniref:Uncharacterized protein n=1 Tax=Prorocentrum cordatum TaxID=2364126 RepID=A0ABN9U8L3_9DINO|nr:unnamed protein product [Polarella glacialis]
MKLTRARLACIRDLAWKFGPNLEVQKVPESAETRGLRESETSPRSILRDPEYTRCTRCAAFSDQPSPGLATQVRLPKECTFAVHPARRPNSCITQGRLFLFQARGGGGRPKRLNCLPLAASPRARGSKRLADRCRE